MAKRTNTPAPVATATVTPFQSTLNYVQATAGIKGKRAYNIARVLLQTGNVTPAARYNRLARAARIAGYKNPFKIARSVLPAWQVELLNAAK